MCANLFYFPAGDSEWTVKDEVQMSISSKLKPLAIAALVLSSCQFVSPTPYIPRVPEIIGTFKVKLIGGDGVVAVNGRTGYAYVAGRFHVTVLKGTQLVSEIETGGDTAFSMAVDEAKGWIYVVNQDTDNVTVIRGTERIGIVPTVGQQPTGVAVDLHTGFAYVVSGHRGRPLREIEGNILVINGTQVIDNLNLGRLALWYVVADPIGGYVYAADISGKIAVIKDLKEVARYDLKRELDAVDVNPRTGEVYVFGDLTLTRFKDGRMVDSIQLEQLPPIWSVRVHPITGDVYVARGGKDPGTGRVDILRNMRVFGQTRRDHGPGALAIDPLTGNVYVANFWEGTNSVTVINGVQTLATIKVGWHPYKIAVNPTNGWVYVSNINDGTVTILGYPGQKTNPYPGP